MLDVLGRGALSNLTSEGEMVERVKPLKYLAMASAAAGEASISEQLRKKYKNDPDKIGIAIDKIRKALLEKLSNIPKADRQEHIFVAAEARGLRLDNVANRLLKKSQNF